MSIKTLRLVGSTARLNALPASLAAQVPDEAEVVEAVDRYHLALAARDVATAMTLLADEVIIMESGSVEARDPSWREHDGRRALRDGASP